MEHGENPEIDRADIHPVGMRAEGIHSGTGAGALLGLVGIGDRAKISA